MSRIITIDVWWSLQAWFSVRRKLLFKHFSKSSRIYQKQIIYLHNKKMKQKTLPSQWQWLTFVSKWFVTTSFRPVYNRSPCLCKTIVYAFLYNSSNDNPELFFFWISWIALFNSAHMDSTNFSSIFIWNIKKSCRNSVRNIKNSLDFSWVFRPNRCVHFHKFCIDRKCSTLCLQWNKF